MENFVLIKYHRLRDFSEKVNTTFFFIKQNFKSLSRALLFIAGPPALLVSLVLGIFIGDFLKIMQLVPGRDNVGDFFFSVNFWLQILLMMVFGVMAYVFTLSVIYNYVILYEEKQTNKIEVTWVWERVRSTFWSYLGTIIIFGVIVFGLYLVMILPMVLLVTISPVLVVFGVFGFIALMAYVFISLMPTFMVRAYEKKGIFSAIGRSFYLIRGKWWSTFGLLFILTLIGGIVSYIFLIPYYVVIFTASLHQATGETYAGPSETLLWMTKIFFALYYLFQILATMLPHIGIAFQYFNLVELKEARGLMSDIEKLGQTTEASPHRPEEQY